MSIKHSTSDSLPPSLRSMRKYFITAKTEIRLRDLLAKHLPPGLDTDMIITAGGVWKNKKRIFDPGFILGPKETVKVHTSSFQGKYYTLDPKQVIFENRDILVVYKPGDLNVHSVPSSFHYNLTWGVNQYLKQKGVKFESTPVTRLDRPVRGLVIFPRNKIAERILFENVKKRRIRKWYTAALAKKDDAEASQKPNPECRRIRDRISNDGNRTVSDPDGKLTDSLFVKTASLESVDIYSVFIFTGRRHQIRFHASTYLTPIAGDWFYRSSQPFAGPGDDQIALVCRGYNIPYKKQYFRVRLPEQYYRDFLDSLPGAAQNKKTNKKTK